MRQMWHCISSIRHFEKAFRNHNGEISHICNYCDFAFKQAIWDHMWKPTFEKMTHMQLMWLCICSSRQFENHIGEISHICNYFAFASIQAGDLWAHVKTHIWENDTYATNVTLHIFNQAIWGDMWTQTFQKNRSHATNVTLHLLKQAIWKS